MVEKKEEPSTFVKLLENGGHQEPEDDGGAIEENGRELPVEKVKHEMQQITESNIAAGLSKTGTGKILPR